jgi:hypothetical protein
VAVVQDGDGVPPRPVGAAPGDVDDAVAEQQRSVAGLEDAARAGQVTARLVPQQPGGPGDFPGPAQQLRPPAGDEHAGVFEQRGERLSVAHEQRVF